MRNSMTYSALALAALTISGIAPRARADVKYTETMTMGNSMMGGAPTGGASANMKMPAINFSSTNTTFLKDNLRRIDTVSKIMGSETRETVISSCAARKLTTFDSSLKLYVVEPLFESAKTATSSTRSVPQKAATAQPKSDGKIVMTPSVKMLGTEKIAGRNTRHIALSMRMQMSGCVGNGDMTLKIEQWLADVALPKFNCENSNSRWMNYAGRGTMGGCVPSFHIKGNLNSFAALTKGLPMKSVMRNPKDGAIISTTQITMLSFARLSVDDFAVPAGFAKVSRVAYDNARQKAMTDAMMSGMKISRGDGEADDQSNGETGEDMPQLMEKMRSKFKVPLPE